MMSTKVIALWVEKIRVETMAEPPAIMLTDFLRDQPNLSWKAEIGTSRILTMEVIPATVNEAKNRKPNKSPPAPMLEIIFGKAIKARPIPPDTTSSTVEPELNAIKPKAANTPIPARISKDELASATTAPEPVILVLRFKYEA